MLYTGKGDGGTTKVIGSSERFSKSSAITEALGNLDELNALLGLIRSEHQSFAETLEEVQQNIFTICAGLAGSEKSLSEKKIAEVEKIIAEAEAELPPITSFSLPGGSAESAWLDLARTVARRAERRAVAYHDEAKSVSPVSLKYLNRLSSLLFALTRLSNHRSGIKESAPRYN